MSQVVINRILVATDFSPASMAALPYAVALARHFGSKLFLTYVIPVDAYSLIPLSERDAALEQMQAHVEEQIDGLRAASPLKGINHEVVIDHGEICPMLCGIVEKYDIDLIVIGTHGRRGVEKLLLGSTAEEVLRLAQRPVLMVGPESVASPEIEVRLQRILYTTDFSSESEPAMHYACSLAKEYGMSLVFLHVAEDVWREPLSTRMQAADFFQLRLLEKHWVLEEEGVKPEFRVEFGPPAESILQAAEKLHIDLIVLGVRGARYPRVAAHLPGPTAYDVVSRARCPVLVIRGESQVQE